MANSGTLERGFTTPISTVSMPYTPPTSSSRPTLSAEIRRSCMWIGMGKKHLLLGHWKSRC
ncbi:MAG: hypothetical protein SFU91_05395 [Chloroherpetonaceae bacterium]|nr:hypothetical protein [Chloroherpetonaceae bacterium]